MSNFSKDKQEYLRITSRFLKEVGLYGLWIKYCYGTRNAMSWVNSEKCSITDILGCTCFTDFVLQHKQKNGDTIYGYCLFEIFGEYVKKMYPNYEELVFDSSKGMVSIDKEKKKIKIEW